jgi:hypothetical protein
VGKELAWSRSGVVVDVDGGSWWRYGGGGAIVTNRGR